MAIERRNVLGGAGFIDTAEADDTALWTPRFLELSATSINWTGSTYNLPVTSDYGEVGAVRPSWGVAHDQAKIKAKARLNGSTYPTAFAGVGFADSGTGRATLVRLYATGDVWVTYDTLPWAVAGSPDQNIGAIPGGISYGHYYWLELIRNGNNRTVNVYDTDGVTVLMTDTAAIPGTRTATNGAGVDMYPAIDMRRAPTGGHDPEIDQIVFTP